MAVKLFSYRKDNSVMHKIPPLVKILIMISFGVISFLGKQEVTIEEIFLKEVWLPLAACFAFVLVFWFLSGHKLSSVKAMRFVIFIGLFITVFRMWNYPFDKVKTINGFISGIEYTFRFFMASFMSQIVFETTSSLEIKDSLQMAENAVNKILPSFMKIRFAFIFSLAITFIPEVFKTWEQVTLAVMARSSRSGKMSKSFKTMYIRLYALISCMVMKAETTRKAVLNRSKSSL
ncbi:MAG: energy-coupling factor transporter transmembrane protein EcfT [Treponema sp.]|nr:energy-coupling factor transporter transmembrane protein EcfT [Treponema sp.]